MALRRKFGAQTSANKPKRKRTAKSGRPFEKGNRYRWPKGVSGNPGGQHKTLSKAYAAWLSLPDDDDPTITNAEAIAVSQGHLAKQGETVAAKEIRQATEGDKVSLYDPSKLTDEQLDRIINGERPDHVRSSDSHSGEGEAQATGQDSQSAGPTPPALDSSTSND